MAICKAKTKNTKLVEPLEQIFAIIYLEVKTVGVTEYGYSASTEYYYIQNQKKKVLKRENISISRSDAKQLFTLLGATGEDFDAQIFDLIPKIAMHMVSNSNDFGTTNIDWELVI